ncbi:MAG: hypothetical protein QCH35_05925 [Methanomicrobiaceae archaeon]|nr:hypothetical protein [Methanomicrobiaceae archaeon]
MDTGTCQPSSARIPPGAGRGMPAITPAPIDSFHEVAGAWHQHDLLIIMADTERVLSGYADIVAVNECSGEERYRTRYARRRHAASYMLARLALAAILRKRSPEDITLVKEPTGGVRIAGEDSVYLCISYTHTLLALAFARAKVGIDIERIRPLAINHIPALVSTICDEQPEIPPDCTAFLQHWTALEAHAKYSNIPLWKMLQNPHAGRQGHAASYLIQGSAVLSVVTETPCPIHRIQCLRNQ